MISRTAVQPLWGVSSLAISVLMGACGQSPALLSGTQVAQRPASQNSAPPPPGSQYSELQKATAYWGKEFQKQPTNLENALSYARNLKALGEKRKALSVLQQASMLHSGDPELASEYGRLALELDQVAVAERLLSVADNPAKPDWRVISARGTVLAKKGLYSQAIPIYERALALSPNRPSIMNNLAMAHAMKGDPATAEKLLRQTSPTTAKEQAKVRQNLALVLGLQGRYAEAKSTAVANAASDTDVIRKIVKLEPKNIPAPVRPQPKTDVALKPSASEAIHPNNSSWKADVALNKPTSLDAPLRGSKN